MTVSKTELIGQSEAAMDAYFIPYGLCFVGRFFAKWLTWAVGSNPDRLQRMVNFLLMAFVISAIEPIVVWGVFALALYLHYEAVAKLPNTWFFEFMAASATLFLMDLCAYYFAKLLNRQAVKAILGANIIVGVLTAMFVEFCLSNAVIENPKRSVSDTLADVAPAAVMGGEF